MNTTELAERVATDTAINTEDVRRVIDGVSRAITAAALRGEEVALSGFGRFKVADRTERQGRNPAAEQVGAAAA
jgi:DNA-binding protein HU-beta